MKKTDFYSNKVIEWQKVPFTMSDEPFIAYLLSASPNDGFLIRIQRIHFPCQRKRNFEESIREGIPAKVCESYKTEQKRLFSRQTCKSRSR